MFRKAILLSLISFVILLPAVKVCFAADVPSQLQQAAELKKRGYFKQAEDAYKTIVANNPATNDALKAQEQLIILYVITGRNIQAKDSLNKLTADFTANPELPASLYWIAKRCRDEGYTDEAATLFQRIVQQYPDSLYAKKAQLDAPRTNILSLLNTNDYTEAEVATDKLLADFAGHPALPEALYDIAKQCKEAGRYDKAKVLYQYILQHYPDCSYASKCRIHIPKIDIWKQIASGDFTAAAATEKFITDFSAHESAPTMVHGIARKYEEVNRFQDAKQLYHRVIQLYPESEAKEKSVLDVRKCDILTLIEAGKDSEALTAVNQMMSDFTGHWYLPYVISQDIAIRYYRRGMELENKNLTDQAVSKFEKAAAIWEKVISQLSGPGVTADACCFAGDSHLRLGNYQKAVAAYQKVITDYPMYRRRWHALASVGHIHEQMKQKGLMSVAEADGKTRAVYQQLIETYPESKASEHAKKWLGQ